MSGLYDSSPSIYSSPSPGKTSSNTSNTGNYAQKSFDFILLLATLVAGLAAWLIGFLIYEEFANRIPNTLLIGLLFLLLVLIVSLTVFVVSHLERGFNNEGVLFLKNTGAIVGGLVVLLILSFLLAAAFQWIYERESLLSNSASSYIFVLDESGSMSDNDPDGLRYGAVDQVLAPQPDEFPYAIYIFADNACLVRDMEAKSFGNDYMVPSYNDLGGGTSIFNALSKILSDYQNHVWSGGAAPKVILLTDGEDFSAINSIGSLLDDYVRAGISISTVGLGSADHSLLTDIAQNTGGVFVPVGQASSLASAMQSAAHGVARRDLVSDRMTPGRNLLYGILRVVFLFLLGALLAFTKSIACAREYSMSLILISGGICSLLGALIMELGTLLGLPSWPCWLILWLLLAATPAILLVKESNHDVCPVHPDMIVEQPTFPTTNTKKVRRRSGRPIAPNGGFGDSFRR